MMPVRAQICIFLNVGLGEAAKRDVGTGTNQIPDMSKWTSLKEDYGWRLTPDGFLEQWGRGNYGNGDGDFVIPFPNRCVFVLISSDPNDTSYAEISQAFPVSNSKFRVGCATAEGNNVNPANLTCNWYAKGW
nr:phage tail protein [Citrobacter freundii]